MEKSALITGATAGIGAEFAQVMAAHGYGLALVARNEQRLVELARILQNQFNVPVKVLPYDLADPATPPQNIRSTRARNFSDLGSCEQCGIRSLRKVFGN
jgi:hypothetical protein